MYYIFFIHSLSVDIEIASMSWLIVNSAAVNIGVPIFFQIIVLSRYMHRSEIARLDGNSNFFRNFHTVLSSYTNLHSQL